MKKIISYTAFYVAEPFNESNLGAKAAHDFCYYSALRLWNATDDAFPFNDAHDLTYNVRDNSQWETLKERLHERLRKSQNIILILSKDTKDSKALHEELEYGVKTLGLPVIIVYPDMEPNKITTEGVLNTKELQTYWDKLPILNDILQLVPTFHVPFKKNYISSAITDPDVNVETKKEITRYFYNA
jgi:hypothetical protein